MRPTLVVRAAATAVVAARLAGGARAAPAISTPTRSTSSPAGSSPSNPSSLPSISVVIAARDEAQRIERAVRSVVGAPGVSEVIVVDDGSTDATVSVAAASGARIVAVEPRPAGWAGKAWAIERGVRSSTGEWILTLDADAVADQGLPAAVVMRAGADGLDLTTVAGRFGFGSSAGQWLHASMLTTLVYRFGPPGRRRRPGRVVANGQCMVFRRADFVVWGGLSPVAASPVEDVALARHLARNGRRVALLDGCSMLTVEPYGSLRATWTGWGRSLGLPGVESDFQRLLDVGTLALVMPIPLLRVLSRRFDVVDVAAIAMRLGVVVATRRVYERRGVSLWASPLADAMAVAAVAIGGFRRRQTWKGRSYVTRGVRPARTSRR